MTRADGSRFALLAAAILLVAPGAIAASDSDAAESAAVAEKVLATMRAAVEGSPEMTVRTSLLGVEAAEARLGTGAGAPTLSWQREGIGSGLERRPNSVDKLKVNLPFNPPWHWGSHRDLRDATERLLQAGDLSGRLEVAALAAQRWLELAAETELAELAEARAVRLEKAVLTQVRRYELGEISGFERTQLELELARERAALRGTEARRAAAEQQVSAIALGGFPTPVGGDLMRLVEGTASASSGEPALDAVVEQAPFLQLAGIRSEVAGAEAESQRRRAWGRPQVELEWERIPEFGPVPGYDAAGFSIAFPLPFGKEGRERMVATEQRAVAATAQRDRLDRELTARVHSAMETARAAEAALESLQEAADRISATEHSLAEQFRLGAISYLVYLDGLSRLDEVRRGMIETRYTLLAARLELAQLVGSDAYFPLPELEGEG